MNFQVPIRCLEIYEILEFSTIRLTNSLLFRDLDTKHMEPLFIHLSHLIVSPDLIHTAYLIYFQDRVFLSIRICVEYLRIIHNS